MAHEKFKNMPPEVLAMKTEDALPDDVKEKGPWHSEGEAIWLAEQIESHKAEITQVKKAMDDGWDYYTGPDGEKIKASPKKMQEHIDFLNDEMIEGQAKRLEDYNAFAAYVREYVRENVDTLAGEASYAYITKLLADYRTAKQEGDLQKMGELITELKKHAPEFELERKAFKSDPSVGINRKKEADRDLRTLNTENKRNEVLNAYELAGGEGKERKDKVEEIYREMENDKLRRKESKAVLRLKKIFNIPSKEEKYLKKQEEDRIAIGTLNDRLAENYNKKQQGL